MFAVVVEFVVIVVVVLVCVCLFVCLFVCVFVCLFVCLFCLLLLLFVCLFVCLFACLFLSGGGGGRGVFFWGGELDPRDTNWYGFNVLSLCIVPLGDRPEMAKLHRREVAILAKQLEDPLIMGDEHQQKTVLAKVCLWIFCTEIHYLI